MEAAFATIQEIIWWKALIALENNSQSENESMWYTEIDRGRAGQMSALACDA